MKRSPHHRPAPGSAIGLAALGLVAALGVSGAAAHAAPGPGAADGPPDLSGRWGQLVVTVEISHIPMVGEVTTVNRALSVLDIDLKSGHPERLQVRERLCALRFESDKPSVQTSVAKGFARTVPTLQRSATLTQRGGGWRLSAPRRVSVHGANLVDPDKDALPTRAEDPRVVDADKDGHPGVTVEVRGMLSGFIRLVQRLWSELRGVVASPDRVDGLVTWGRDQEILDATHLFLKTAPPREVHPNKARHWFRWRRVAAGTDCEALAAQAETLFAP